MDRLQIVCQVAFSLFLFVPCFPAQADDFIVYGYGLNSCGSWTTAHRQDNSDAKMQGSWLGGYISAFNNYERPNIGNVAAGTDFEGMEQWVTDYCAKNPLDKIDTAAQKLIGDLGSRKKGALTR